MPLFTASEYITFPLTLLLMSLAYHRLFPGAMQKGFRVVIYFVSGIFIAMYSLTGTLFMSKTVLYMEIAAILAAVYILIRLAFIVRKPSTEQRVLFYGLGIVLLTIIIVTRFAPTGLSAPRYSAR